MNRTNSFAIFNIKPFPIVSCGKMTDDLEEFKGEMKELVSEKPEIKKFMDYVETAEAGDSLDTKTKELMSLAIGVVLRCGHCIEWHTNAAIESGVTEDEFKDALEVAVLMGGGPALAYATDAYQTYKDMKA